LSLPPADGTLLLLTVDEGGRQSPPAERTSDKWTQGEQQRLPENQNIGYNARIKPLARERSRASPAPFVARETKRRSTH
jgi:hypothetical protein